VNEFFSRLKRRLQEKPGRTLVQPGAQLRESAVLAPMFARGGEPWLLFTKRPTTLRRHAGQISFPGGTRDEEDSTPLHTALRETKEELGIPGEAVEVLGMLDEHPTITSFRIVPFVGVIPDGLPLRPNPDEIAELIEVPVRALLSPSLPRVEMWNVMEREREVYFYDYGAHVIWGATARILKDLLAIIRELNPDPLAPQTP
jgi:8-oxo-dGTP pyrophosphatase MutT (NUDIX family)